MKQAGKAGLRRGRTTTAIVALCSALSLVSIPAASARQAVPSTPGSSATTGRSDGDFNGDGFSDLAVGVPLEDLNGQEDTGAVQVIYGGPAGLTATGNQFCDESTVGVGTSTHAKDEFGKALAAGDFDGDGYSDLAIGAPYAVIHGHSQAGAIYVLYGGPGGLGIAGARRFTQDSPNVKASTASNAAFGSALRVGDFGWGDEADLAVGIPGQTVNSATAAGAIAVLYGGASGLSARHNQLIDRSDPGIKGSATYAALFGRSLAAGNMGRDDHTDLAAVGSGVSVIYGSHRGLSTKGNQLWTRNSKGIAATTIFGDALAAGDFGHSRFADLAIGVPGEGHNKKESGGAQVLYGTSDGLRAKHSQLWTADSPGIRGAARSGVGFGGFLTAANFGKGPRTDLAIRAASRVAGNAFAGTVTVIYGRQGGLSANGNQLWSEASPGIAGTPQRLDLFGNGLAAANLGHSRFADLAVGVPLKDTSGIDDSGAINVIYGSQAGLHAPGNQLWSQDTPGIPDSAEDSDVFGGWLSTYESQASSARSSAYRSAH